MAEAAPSCDTWFVVRSEDTCFSIAQAFRLTSDSFVMLNPNLSCTALFVGQWASALSSIDHITMSLVSSCKPRGVLVLLVTLKAGL
ncbi:hypothetical protein RJ639_009839 [Escallonia herrerae]|uniref:LysM domain-containing protein n=1 Tax=Escallonia herrerae TaxID=1293975 RepID=A0AA88VSL1_9ASTE|nr:hypothetical protein RJ639_009839 [Escallonia herrerae]